MVGSYQDEVGQASCKQCAAGNYCPTAGSSAALLCVAGTYQAASGQASCIQCDAGNYCAAESIAQSPCAAGSYSSDPSVACALCPPSTYSDIAGASVCTTCPSGRTTPGPGTISQDACLSPIPNFAMGYVCLGVVALTIFMYISRGRFHRVAFLRKYR